MGPRRNDTNKGRPDDRLTDSKAASPKKLDSFFMKASSSKVKTFKKTPNEPKKTKVQKSDEPNENAPTKKPFDKKAWRLKKYSKKYKLQQWENKRKHTVVQGYYKAIKHDDSQKFDVEKIYNEYEEEEPESEPDQTDNSEQSKGKKGNKRKPDTIEDAESRKQEALQRKAEKEAAIKEYKKKKIEKFKILNKKTKKGQPVMKGRIELLLEEIQQSISNNK